jgi:plastocyanin
MMRRRGRAFVLVLAIAGLLPMAAPGTAQAVTVRVRGIYGTSGFVWSPKAKAIVKGTTVRWRAVEGSHTVKSRGANWSYFRNVPLGYSVTRTFRRAGVFKYYCTIHGQVMNGVCSGMCGRIVVS